MRQRITSCAVIIALCLSVLSVLITNGQAAGALVNPAPFPGLDSCAALSLACGTDGQVLADTAQQAVTTGLPSLGELRVICVDLTLCADTTETIIGSDGATVAVGTFGLAAGVALITVGLTFTDLGLGF